MSHFPQVFSNLRSELIPPQPLLLFLSHLPTLSIHSPILRPPPLLHIVAINPRRTSLPAAHRLAPTIKVDIFEVESVDMTRKIALCRSEAGLGWSERGVGENLPKDCEADVDDEVCAAASDEVNADGGDWGVEISVLDWGSKWRGGKDSYLVW